MYTAFISQAFFINLEKCINSKYFGTFIFDFFSQLNLKYIVTDFDLLNSEFNQYNKMYYRSFLNLGNGVLYRIEGYSIDGLLSTGENTLNSRILNEEIKSENVANRIYFVHLDKDLLNSTELIGKPIISSADFDNSFRNFLINGKIKNSIRYADFISKKDSLNVWECKGAVCLLIDDPYFLIKKGGKKPDIKSIANRIKNILSEFLSSSDVRRKIVVFHIPTYELDDRKEKWSDDEQLELKRIIKQITSKICSNSFCETIFHNMPTHARFALSNRHLVELTGGFDYIRMEKEYLLTTNDNISFSSIYLLDKHDVLAGLYNNRIRFTSAINHFPQANI